MASNETPTTSIDDAPKALEDDPAWQPAPLSIAARVSSEALAALIEQSQQGARGIYKDAHPWVVAKRLAVDFARSKQWLPLLLASGESSEFQYWTRLMKIEVMELHRASWQSRVELDALWRMHPIFGPIDSVYRQPSAEQLEREDREQLSVHRFPLTAAELHPYAICLTPAFVLEGIPQSAER